MKHTDTNNGMTCNGYRSQVEKTLNEVDGVAQASVNLETAEAVIEMESHIELDTFQNALKEAGGNYTIHRPGTQTTTKGNVMKHTYPITGMTCNGCRSHVEKTLSEVDGVNHATVDLEKAEATIEMDSHIPIETFQKALKDGGGNYQIHKPGADKHQQDNQKQEKETPKGNGTGTFYCPMHCEGDKTYD